MTGKDPEVEGHCNDVLESMYLFIDEEVLTDAHRDQIREHIDDCIPCLESFEFEAELKQVIKKRCQDDVPTHVYEKVRARLIVEIEANAPKNSHANEE